MAKANTSAAEVAGTAGTDRAIEASKVAPGVPRMLIVRSSRWQGGRPGTVVRDPEGTPGNFRVYVNVQLDGVLDAGLLRAFRSRERGNTVGPIEVYDALDEAAREIVAEKNSNADMAAWAEWPARG